MALIRRLVGRVLAAPRRFTLPLEKPLGGLDWRPEGPSRWLVPLSPRALLLLYAEIPPATLANAETVRSQFLSLRH